jgi:hypothetical protein
MAMMQVAVAGSDFKVQNLSKRFAEVKTLQFLGRVFAVPPRNDHLPKRAMKVEKKDRCRAISIRRGNE